MTNPNIPVQWECMRWDGVPGTAGYWLLTAKATKLFICCGCSQSEKFQRNPRQPKMESTSKWASSRRAAANAPETVVRKLINS